MKDEKSNLAQMYLLLMLFWVFRYLTTPINMAENSQFQEFKVFFKLAKGEVASDNHMFFNPKIGPELLNILQDRNSKVLNSKIKTTTPKYVLSVYMTN